MHTYLKTIALSLILVLFASACSHKTESNVTDPSQAEEAAQKSAEQWLALVDAGNFAESWKTAAGYFQTAISQDKWEQTITAVRGPLGDVVTRKLKSTHYAQSLPDAPAGEYVVLQFDTSFANKKDTVETITPKLDPDGKWKVSGYFIK
jgi:Protein of unknown function (DUF4019)